MPVLTIDLGDLRVREAALSARVGKFISEAWEGLTGESVSLIETPIRVILLMPLDAELAAQSEIIAASILGSDPAPRVIAALLPARDSDNGVPSRAIPEWFAINDGVRFIELRATAASVANPQRGISSVSTGSVRSWSDDFRKDVLAQLTDPELFDAAWRAIPLNRPAAVGLRIVSLGEGRSRAVADLAFRLAEELDPNREPETGTELPERWELDSRLYPVQPPYPTDPAYIAALPAPIRGLAAVKRGNLIAIASRTTRQYEDAVTLGLNMLLKEPPRIRSLIENAERSEVDGPYLDPVGAAALEAEFPGAVFGESLAREYAEKADAAEKVGELLNRAADSQADGLSASLLAHWFNDDANRVRPSGPKALAARLESSEQQWSQLARAINEIEPSTAPSRSWLPWLISFATGGPEMMVRSDVVPAENHDEHDKSETTKEQSESVEVMPTEEQSLPDRVDIKLPATTMHDHEQAEYRSDLKDESVEKSEPAVAETKEVLIKKLVDGTVPGEEAWRLPHGLGFVFGSFIWRRRIRAYAFTALTVGLLITALAQVVSDVTGFRIIDTTVFGLAEEDRNLLVNTVRWITLNAIGYFVISMISALALAQWAEAFRFHEIPDALALLRADARAIALAEAGRLTSRRDYSRLSVEAAGTLLAGTARGSETAKLFGEQVPINPRTRSSLPGETPPHRRHVGDEVVFGTDAAGIYRVYRLYVIALRQLFALSLVAAVKERWPRIRGTYWKETRALVAEQVSISLRNRLQTVLDRGLLKGDLLRNGVDPAEQVAKRIWSDPVVRGAALDAMRLQEHDSMPVLVTPSENRLLDLQAASGLVVSIPSTLEDLLQAEDAMPEGVVVASRSLEEVAVFRFYPYQEDIYRIESGPTGETGLVS